MIEITQYSDEKFESQFVPLIQDAYADVQNILEKVPKTLQIKFKEGFGSEITGVGGYASSKNQIELGVVSNFNDPGLQRKNLRSVIFHESFHINQGFTYENSPFTALDSMIYEGCAVKFERDYGDNDAIYCDYSMHSNAQLMQWLDEIKQVGTEYFEDLDTWHKWAFYHPEYKEKWIIYRVGSFVLDNILENSGHDIIDFKDKSANEIFKLANL